jgi:NADH:ubiquinone oxidoreductase subunit H
LITVTERFFLSLSQVRLGPQKVSFLAFLQMVFDGLKLFFSDLVYVKKTDNLFFSFFPLLSFFLIILFFLFLPYNFVFLSWVIIIIFVVLLIGLLVFFLILSSFLRKSKFSFFGLVRIVTSSLGFDIIFIFLIFFLIFFYLEIVFNKIFFWIFFLLIIMFLLLMVEVHRAPFDFSEGERELVSGFNTELRGFLFVLVFLSEYGFLVFYILLIILVFVGGSLVLGYFIFFCFIEVRAVFPRFRYDYNISFC